MEHGEEEEEGMLEKMEELEMEEERLYPCFKMIYFMQQLPKCMFYFISQITDYTLLHDTKTHTEILASDWLSQPD